MHGRDRRRWSAPAAVLALFTAVLALPPAWAAWTATTVNPTSSLAAAADFRAGRLYGWGDNLEANLGLGNNVGPQLSVVTVGSATDWFDVSTGNNHYSGTWNSNSGHSCGLRGTGTLWCWGENAYGQLGTGNTTDQTTPVQIGTATDWTDVEAGDLLTCGLRTGGTLWCWGYNNFGGIGQGDSGNTHRLSPTQVSAGTGMTWRSVGMGSVGACAIRSDGTLWCWGYNGTGQAGNGNTSTTVVASPSKVGTATTWRQVTGGWYHHCATQTDGTLWCWGEADDGRLGLGSGVTTDQSVPVQVALLPTGASAGTTWSSVAAGSSHTCATRSDRTLWCWGNGGNGRLGSGSTTSRSTPGQVGTATTWNSVTPGWSHTCGTQRDRTVWCWGGGADGSLGSGGTTDATTPTKVSGITGPVTTGSGSSTVFVIE
ncbi:hypothetical protein NUM3379_06720 [Kineococcus sp. NUM-3379]